MIGALTQIMVCTCTVYDATRETPEEPSATLSAERRATIRWRAADELFASGPIAAEPAVLIATGALLERTGGVHEIPEHIVVVAADAESATALGDRADITIVDVQDVPARAALLDAACCLAAARFERARMERELARIDDEYGELSRIGLALMQERDRVALLNLIVEHGKLLTESDGGGVLLLSTDEQGVAQLKPVVFKLDSLPAVSLLDIRFAVDNTSIVGHAALDRKPVVVADAEALPPDSVFVASAEFKRRFGYPARSMLAVPMLTQRDEVLGVVFFINRKSDPNASVVARADSDRYVVPFMHRHVRLARSLASMAAIAIENARLYIQIEQILESFVEASVSAIDARDPTTAGHSLRVAALATGLAEAVQRAPRGRYHDVRFTPEQMRELHFAALLHDIGKVAVREDVLVKAKKLPPVLWERVDARFGLIRRTLELENTKRRADACQAGVAEPQSSARLDAHLAEQLRELDREREIVRAANEPSVLETPQDGALTDIATHTFEAADGHDTPYLTADELHYLQLARGTLDDRERAEVESHVEKTHAFLDQIPWTDDLKNLVKYASGHHEKLNGSGYPKHLERDEIPIQTRMITLADMFDALTASDRPYKAAVTAEKALEILRADADAGLLDRDLVDIMTESQVYKTILD